MDAEDSSSRVGTEGAKATFDQLLKIAAPFSRQLNELVAGLREAKGQSDGRLGAMHALRGVIKFIDGFDDLSQEGLVGPVLVLFEALMDAQDGRRPDLIQPTPLDHRPTAGAAEQALKGYAAAAMGLYMQADMRLQAAAQRVAVALASAGYRLPGRDRRAPTWRTIKNWRADVTGHADAGMARQLFKRTIEKPVKLELPAAVVADYICASVLPDLANKLDKSPS